MRLQYLHLSTLFSNGLGLVSIAYVSMETKVCGLLQSKNDMMALQGWSMKLGEVNMETKACRLL